MFENGPLPLDVALIQVSPPDADGWCSLGVSVDVVKSAAKCARMVIAQINPKMPRTCGDSRISTRQIDYFIEHAAALPEMPRAVLDERHERIGRYAAQLIDDGSTIQVGLGNTPEAVARALKKHRHLGIHSGLFNDALMDLVRCGAVDSSRKTISPGKIIASHVMGSRKLYQFVDGNADIELHPSDWVNDPAPHRAQRPDGGDQRRAGDRSDRPGGAGLQRAPVLRRHRRACRTSSAARAAARTAGRSSR